MSRLIIQVFIDLWLVLDVFRRTHSSRRLQGLDSWPWGRGGGGGGGGGGLSGCSNPMRILIFLAIVVYLLYGNSLRRGL